MIKQQFIVNFFEYFNFLVTNIIKLIILQSKRFLFLSNMELFPKFVLLINKLKLWLLQNNI